ncbi:hypothetical protein [Streptomyces sp. NPDC051364]|uniref:hypothetical protein n=1 Tax=Streptomyces sp. NPDC051364 TaxID=3155799 RepID=UPI00343ABF16
MEPAPPNPELAAAVRVELEKRGVLELPWMDEEFSRYFWEAAQDLSAEQAGRIGQAVFRAMEWAATRALIERTT